VPRHTDHFQLSFEVVEAAFVGSNLAGHRVAKPPQGLMSICRDDGDDVPYPARKNKNNHQDNIFSFWDNGGKQGHHRHQCHQHRCGRREQAVLTKVLSDPKLQEQLQQASQHPGRSGQPGTRA
jgi:hypothetical protein